MTYPVPHDRPVRYAVIGYGLAGSAFHAPIVAATSGAELSVVVVRSDAARAEVRRRYPGVRVVADAVELTAADVDVAVVATPNPTHAAIAGLLIDAGIAVVVDKPLAATSREAAALIDQAAAAGVPLTCYQNRRWDGDFRTVRALTERGALGRLLRLESRFERWRPAVKESWKESPGPGSGVLFDLGPHVIDQALVLAGPVASVSGWARIVRPGALVPDDAFVELRHESGVISHLSVSLVAAAPGPRFRVLGDGGAYVKDGLDPQEDALRSGALPGGPGWGTEPTAAHGRLFDDAGSHPIQTLPGDYPAFYTQLSAALRGNAPLPVDPIDSLTALEICESIPTPPPPGP